MARRTLPHDGDLAVTKSYVRWPRALRSFVVANTVVGVVQLKLKLIALNHVDVAI